MPTIEWRVSERSKRHICPRMENSGTRSFNVTHY